MFNILILLYRLSAKAALERICWASSSNIFPVWTQGLQKSPRVGFHSLLRPLRPLQRRELPESQPQALSVPLVGRPVAIAMHGTLRQSSANVTTSCTVQLHRGQSKSSKSSINADEGGLAAWAVWPVWPVRAAWFSCSAAMLKTGQSLHRHWITLICCKNCHSGMQANEKIEKHLWFWINSKASHFWKLGGQIACRGKGKASCEAEPGGRLPQTDKW